MKSRKHALLVIASLTLTVQSHGQNVTCEQNLADTQTASIPAKNHARFELAETLQCRWIETGEEPTASILFKAPESTGPIEIEIATRLDVKDSTAIHIAMLNSEYTPVQWIPFSSFRERKGYLAARFFVNPTDTVKYILVGGARKASEQTLNRTYSPASTSLLNVAGLITAREVNTDFNFVPTGKIRIRMRKPHSDRVDVTQ